MHGAAQTTTGHGHGHGHGHEYGISATPAAEYGSGCKLRLCRASQFHFHDAHTAARAVCKSVGNCGSPASCEGATCTQPHSSSFVESAGAGHGHGHRHGYGHGNDYGPLELPMTMTSWWHSGWKIMRKEGLNKEKLNDFFKLK